MSGLRFLLRYCHGRLQKLGSLWCIPLSVISSMNEVSKPQSYHPKNKLISFIMVLVVQFIFVQFRLQVYKRWAITKAPPESVCICLEIADNICSNDSLISLLQKVTPHGRVLQI
jgi:hypothetical protein